MRNMRALLISTYDLGRQPLGLASQAAWLREAGATVECVDTSRDDLRDDHIREADVVAFYLPMHTATRLTAPLIERVRTLNPTATLAAYGLYAPLNAAWLRERGVSHVLGPEVARTLAQLVATPGAPPGTGLDTSRGARVPVRPDRSTLPPLSRYAALQMPDGTRRVVGNTDATRGCKHLCRHCPIVPVYAGTFRAVPVDDVMHDIHAQVSAGAQHITFGDPDFFNGPTHARRVVLRLARECHGVSYDVTIKIEHLLKHQDLLPLLRDTGCLVITSAVESVDDQVLVHLRKGHTRADFVRALALCRAAGVSLSPTFVPFTPWTTLAGYADLLDAIEALDLVEAVAPIQLAIRLLVTAQSALLDLPDIQRVVESYDPQSLLWPWRHHDPRVDALQREVMRVVAAGASTSRRDLFERIAQAVREDTGSAETLPRASCRGERSAATMPGQTAPAATPPFLTEPWYCCAEPGPELHDLM